MKEVTRLLNAIEEGDETGVDELLPLIYDELRQLAAQKLSHEPPGQTLQATALVHEAYLRVVGVEDRSWKGRRHFFMAAAEAMRRILVDRARRRKRIKRGGGLQRVDLELAEAGFDNDSDELLALDEALGRLDETEPIKAELVKLRFFAGLTNAQAAEALGLSTSTADRYWAYARSWLHLEISKGDSSPP